MKYMGSKARFAKEIIPIMLKDREPHQCYVEPFAGGMNAIQYVVGNRIANDNNKYLIAMWDGLNGGRDYLRDIPKELYNDVRDCFNGKNDRYDDFTIGWVGFMASANGRFFEGGYSGKSNTKVGTVRDYIAESIRNIEKQIPSIKGAVLTCSDYRELYVPQNSILYCDIPYEGTKQYSTSKGFDHKAFWQWCRDMSAKGHKVFVSEYNAPEDFDCIWEKKAKSSLSANGKIGGNKVSTERLFVFSGSIETREA